ncbi:MAG: FAD-binding oxidoreductase [Microbacterium sp.]|uniref:FAD-binding oxidoreductase n=1 Tax=Microbacterium sp. TaxID=51671 RepID=UPI0039E2ED7B
MTPTIPASFDGTFVRNDSPEFEQARLEAVWNGRVPSRRPAAIVQARTAADVQAAVRLAAREGWRISVRSGGHSWIANGVRDDTLLIDLSALDEVAVDAAGQRVTIQPGTRVEDLHARLDAVGLVFPGGHYPTVGLGGFLLGGGYGWNSRKLGPACLSVEAVDLVLADGTAIHADDESHPDLMWAVRGAGPGFFAIVTKYYLRAYPAYTQVLRSVQVFDEELRDDVMGWVYEHLAETSPSLEIAGKTTWLEGHDRPVTMLVGVGFCADETPDEIYRVFESHPFRGRALRTADRVPSSLPDLWATAAVGMPKGKRYAVDGVWTEAATSDVLAAARPLVRDLPTRDSFVFWMFWGHYPTQRNACWSTQAPLYFSPNGVWDDPADDLLVERWAHHDLAAFAAHADQGRGTQFSDANPGDRPDRGIEPAQRERLESLRTVYDPDGLLSTYLTPAESATALGAWLRRR